MNKATAQKYRNEIAAAKSDIERDAVHRSILHFYQRGENVTTVELDSSQLAQFASMALAHS